MINQIVHVGLIVSDIEQSIKFYRDVLGLNFVGRMEMSGDATNKLFNILDATCDVAYLNGSDNLISPPIELICFKNKTVKLLGTNFNDTSIAEVCFDVDNLDYEYSRLKDLGVEFLSSPQYFDFTKFGFSKSKAVYFKDPDGLILELIETIKD